MMGDAMDVFVAQRGEIALARLMHADRWPVVEPEEKPKKVGRADNRKGVTTFEVKQKIEEIKRAAHEKVFSVSDMAKAVDIPRPQAAWVIGVMIQKNIARRVPKIHGEQGFRYKLDEKLDQKVNNVGGC